MNKLKDVSNKSLIEVLEENLSGENFLKGILSSKRKKSSKINKVLVRPLGPGSDGEKLFQAEYHSDNKVTHTNLPAKPMAALCFGLLSDEFKQANFFCDDKEIQILAAKIDKPRITCSKASQLEKPVGGLCTLQTPSHNRTKNYIIQDGVPCDFLIRLGVMGEDGKVFRKHYSKFRQINRYLEIVDDVFPLPENGAAPSDSDRPLKIVDFGCGKAYLTFALYYYLHQIKGMNIEIVGLDLKEDVITFCNGIARDLNYDNLNFLLGDIADYKDDHVDMVITLHACDTATDYALINGVSWGTKVILSVPCCQHELFKQIKNDLHHPLLKHGILKDRLTEYLTDGIRGLWLEAKGYNVSMIEFTSLEHTSRNILIRAVKSTAPEAINRKKAAAAKKQLDDLCQFYNITPLICKYL